MVLQGGRPSKRQASLASFFEGAVVVDFVKYDMLFKVVILILPHQVKTQYLHFRFHANYVLLP